MKSIFSRRRVTPIRELEEQLAGLRTAAPFVPTPWSIARRMLEMAEVGLDDTVYDLGSGDGRIPILAAQEFGCKAVGIERDRDLCRYSERRVAELGLEKQVAFQFLDFFQADFRPATVVTMYLLSAVNGQLQPRLASHLRPDSRVVALDFEVPGWRSERTATVCSEASVEYTLLLYLRTARSQRSAASIRGSGCAVEQDREILLQGADHENTGAIISDLGSVDRSGISSFTHELQPKNFRNAGTEFAVDSRRGSWRVGAARHEPAGKCVPRRVFGQDGRN